MRRYCNNAFTLLKCYVTKRPEGSLRYDSFWVLLTQNLQSGIYVYNFLRPFVSKSLFNKLRIHSSWKNLKFAFEQWQKRKRVKGFKGVWSFLFQINSNNRAGILSNQKACNSVWLLHLTIQKLVDRYAVVLLYVNFHFLHNTQNDIIFLEK